MIMDDLLLRLTHELLLGSWQAPLPSFIDLTNTLTIGIPMNYLPGKFLGAIFTVRSGPCFDAHAQVNCFDFTISSKVHMFSTFSASNKYKMLAKFQISKSKLKNGCCDLQKVQQCSPKCAVGGRIVGTYNLRFFVIKSSFVLFSALMIVE